MCYRAAQAAGDGSASIKTTEQLADMLARRGSVLLDSAETQDQGKELLRDAEALVDSLLKIDSTAERYCLRGSIWKRRLPVINDDELDSALQSMAEAYQDAERLADKRGGRLYYPAISVLHATLLRQLLGTLPGGTGRRTGTHR
ncbi:tetratricopeptide repeat-containing protein [Azotobacter chroococcum]